MRHFTPKCYYCAMNLPNQLTMARCVLAVFFVVFMSFDHTGSYALAYALFAAAAITDSR